MRPMNKLFRKIFFKDSDNYAYWIIFALAFRIVIFILYLLKGQYGEIPGFIGIVSGDFYYYITSIENYITKGTYSPDMRMPGYGIIYYFFRLFANQANALNIIIILQYLLSAISVYFLAVTVKNIFKVKEIFYICFYLYLINTFASKFDSYSQPDSFTCSATIFSVYFLEKFIREFKFTYLIITGILLCWIVFLKPVYLPLYLIYLIIIAYYFIKKRLSIVNIIKYMVIFLLPFLIFDSIWVYRNYNRHNKIICLQTSTDTVDNENTYMVDMARFIKSWGGDNVRWNPKAEITWFDLYGKNNKIKQQSENIKLPGYIYTSKFNEDSLIKIKTYMSIYLDTTTNVSEKEKLNKMLSEKLKLYTRSVKDEKPFLYFVKAPIMLFKNFLFHPSKYEKDEKNKRFFKRLTGFYSSFIYLFVIITGLIGLITMLIANFSFDVRIIIPGITVYSLIIFPVIFRMIEYRYLVPVFPFITACSAYFIYQLISMKIWQKQK